MPTLWTFGDSYGVHLIDKPEVVNDWFWTYDVANQLNCLRYGNLCQMGVSNSYIQHTIQEHSDQIKSEDYVIIVSTSSTRRWLIEDKPYISNFYAGKIEQLVDSETFKAINYYIKHLINSKEDHLNMHSFLGWVHYMSDKHNWNVIVIPGFEYDSYPVSHKYTVNGSLMEVCFNEFATTGDCNWYYDNFCKGRDMRSGHMTKDNHTILANKIVDTFTNNTVLDLKNGFNKKIISRKTIDSLADQLPGILTPSDITSPYVNAHSKLYIK
jgi:hypothetical protein